MGIGLLVIVLALHVFGFGLQTRLPDYLRNALHAPAFGLLAVVMQRLLQRRWARGRAYGLAAALALMIGAVGEILQSFGSRDADLADLAIDVVGIAAGLGLLATADAGLRPRWRWTCGVLGAVAAAFVAYPFVWYVQVVQARAAALPVLLDFEADWEQVLYSRPEGAAPRIRDRPDGWPGHGEKIAELTLDRPKTPGLKVFDPYPDWRGFTHLSLVAATTGPESLTVVLRIHDDQHDYTGKDRFRRRFEIDNMSRRFTIDLAEVKAAPEGRDMNLGEIDAIILYLPKPKGGERLLIDDLRLKPAPP